MPLHLPLDTPLPRQCSMAVPLLEAIEHRAARYSVPVDARIERGRDRRHALRETIERPDVIAASGPDSDGFHTDDVAWLLDHAPRRGGRAAARPRRDDPRLHTSARIEERLATAGGPGGVGRPARGPGVGIRYALDPSRLRDIHGSGRRCGRRRARDREHPAAPQGREGRADSPALWTWPSATPGRARSTWRSAPLMVSVLTLVFTFESSAALAFALGMAT